MRRFAGATVATLLRKMHKSVASLCVHAEGQRRVAHPLSFESIILSFSLATDAGEAEISRALQLAEDSYCPVWAMLKGNVQIKYTWALSVQE